MFKLSLMISVSLILFTGCVEDKIKSKVLKEFINGNIIVCKSYDRGNNTTIFEISTKEYKYIENDNDKINIIPIDNNKPYLSFQLDLCGLINQTIKEQK